MKRCAITFRYKQAAVTITPVEPNPGEWRVEPNSKVVYGSELARLLRAALSVESDPPYESRITISGGGVAGRLSNNTFPAHAWWYTWDYDTAGGSGCRHSLEESLLGLVEAIFKDTEGDDFWRAR
jgi:hypothetical protein